MESAEPGTKAPEASMEASEPSMAPPKAKDGLVKHSAMTNATSVATIAFEMDLAACRT
jgi:hypothetical protein